MALDWDDSYSGDLSFFRSGRTDDPESVDLAILGIPYDLGTTGRPGARFGPRAIREQSVHVGEFEWGLWPWNFDVRDAHKVRDFGDVQGFTAYPDRLTPVVHEKAKSILASGANLLCLGGDHFVSYPLLKAHAEIHGPLALVHFDAHSDTWVDGDLNHGTMFYHGIREGWIDCSRSIHVGLRTPNPETHGIEIIDANACLEMSAQAVAARIKDRVGTAKAYLTFDIDFLDPAFAPATGTPVIGGPSVAYARHVLEGLAGLDFVGGDQVEVAPHYEGPSQITALAGATIAADILYLLSLARSQRQDKI
ncbi:agmatinase [Temperatibacter marinus]|uniref:Agmatinase n=1 Tax=Temperatibacter marinus TaxID=1456591 RepID=A0AA52EFD3_9PROT|nr:agmatinase [Temperatibacter marinus]WND02088.1 agmatinase [Temperatibacter marinus]